MPALSLTLKFGGGTRHLLLRNGHIGRYGPIGHLTLPPVGPVLSQHTSLEKDFAEGVQGLCHLLMDPSPGATQHPGDLIAREIVESDEGDHFRVVIAQTRQAELDVANEDGLFLEAGNGMMRYFGTKELSSQQGWQPSHLGRDFEKVPHNSQGLAAKAQHFRPGIDLKQLFLGAVFFPEYRQAGLAGD